MNFPVYLSLGPLQLHPHLAFESLAFGVSFGLGRLAPSSDPISPAQRLLVTTAALAGALLGTKGLVLWQHWPQLVQRGWSWSSLLQGKTIVGAILGAWLAVELVKKAVGIRVSTGDRYVYPLLFGTAIGRIGCFLTGLADDTYGLTTTLPWAVDFGDGLGRHPTQLYEIVFLLGLFGWLRWRERRGLVSGDRFQLYCLCYLGFRLLIDGIKPGFRPWLGITPIQLACAGTLLLNWRQWPKLLPPAPSSPHSHSSGS